MDPRRLGRPSAVAGVAIWAAWLTTEPGPVLRWVLLAPLVVVPLLLPLIGTPTRDGDHPSPYRLAVFGQLPAAVSLTAATLLPTGPVAVALALPWLAETTLVALFGLRRFGERGLFPIEETVLDGGLAYLPVGAVALLLDRAGVSLLFSPLLIRLTAAHFHYATVLLPVALGLLGRRFAGQRRAYAGLAVLAVGSVPFLALGITVSPALEFVAACTFAGSVAALGGLLVVASPRVWGEDAPAAAALAVSGAALVVTMALAVGYAVEQFFGVGPVTIPYMLRTHAPLNVAGFALPALLALHRLDLPSRAPPPGLPLSPLTAGWRVGGDYPRRAGLVGRPLAGQVDSMARYDRDGFAAAALAPAVRAFYERTADYDLAYTARWHRPFRRAAGLAMGVTHRIGQLALPTDDELHRMVGTLRAIPAVDDRQGARYWLRSDPETGDTVYVAAYGTHDYGGVSYMNVGMPLPGTNLSAILRPVAEGDGSLRLTSARDGGDAGLYLRTPLGPLRLPMHEEFRVWPAGAEGAPEPPKGADDELPAVDLVATHEMWVLGQQFLTLRYAIGTSVDAAGE